MNKIIKTLKIHYNYGKAKGVYLLHEMSNGEWHWEALGNNGKEDTQNLAMYAAKLWITESTIRKDN